MKKKTSVLTYLNLDDDSMTFLAIASFLVVLAFSFLSGKILSLIFSKDLFIGYSLSILTILSFLFLIFSLLAIFTRNSISDYFKGLSFTWSALSFFFSFPGVCAIFIYDKSKLIQFWVPGFSNNCSNVGTPAKYCDCLVLEFIFACSIAIVLCIIIPICKKFIVVYWQSKLYKVSTYLPISVEELKEHNINNPAELEYFLENDLFSKLKGKCYNFNPIRNNIRKSYYNVMSLCDFPEIKEEDKKEFMEKASMAFSGIISNFLLYGENTTCGTSDPLTNEEVIPHLIESFKCNEKQEETYEETFILTP